MNETDLVMRARAGDQHAWLALVDTHGQAVFRLAYLLTANADDAADVAQETLLHAFRHLERFEPGQPLRPWLLRIARNQAYNRRRSIRRFMAALGRMQRHAAVIPAQPDGTMHADVWQALQWVSEKDREVIYLRYFLELSVAETAAALEVAEGTVKSRLARALGRMREVLVRHDPELAEEGRA